MTTLFLPLILLLGAFLRLYHLSSLPISLFGDEVDVGYHAWSLFTTGRDYLGNLLPTYLHSLSEWRAPLLMYLTAPFVGFLSPSNFSVRLPVALLGVFDLYLIYRLGKKLFSVKIGLLSALILAITPWHIHYSRAAFETTLLASLIGAGILFYLSKKYFPAFIFFALTFYTYSIANLFIPLLILLLLYFYRPEKIRLSTGVALKFLTVLLLLLPIAYQLTVGPAAGRFKLISVSNDPKISEDVILQRTAPWVIGDRMEVLFHNKVIANLAAIGRSYLTSFSTDFLFINGDPNFRQSVSRFGELLWVSAPFLLLGLAASLNKKDNASRLLLSWLILAPLGSSLTQGGGNHATRLFVMLAPLTLLTAIGLDSAGKIIHRLNRPVKISLVITLMILTLANLSGYWHRYENHYRFESARVWNYGYAEIFSKLVALDRGQGRVFINNTYDPALLRFAFYTRLSPIIFQKSFQGDVASDSVLPHFNGFRFGDRYYFGQIDNYENLGSLLSEGDLYLAVQSKEIPGDWDWSKSPPVGIKALATTDDVYGLPLFYLLEKTGK